MKKVLRLLTLAFLSVTLLALLVSCGEEEGTCKITVVANGKEIVSSYEYNFKGDATVLDALKAAAKDVLKEDLVDLKNDRGTVLSFASLKDLTTTLSEDGKTLSYWGYTVKGVDGNLVAGSGEQAIQDEMEITFTYHSIKLPVSKDAIPVSFSVQITETVDGILNNTNYKNLQISEAGLTMKTALEAVAKDTSVDATHQALLASIATAVKEGKSSYETENAVWAWSVSVKDKSGADKSIDFTSEDELKSGDVINLVITAAAPAADDNDTTEDTTDDTTENTDTQA